MIARILAACIVSAMCLSFASAQVEVSSRATVGVYNSTIVMQPATYHSGNMSSALAGCCLQWTTNGAAFQNISSYPSVLPAANFRCSNATQDYLPIASPTFSNGVYNFHYDCWSVNSSIHSGAEQFNVTITVAASTGNGPANTTTSGNATSSTGAAGNTTSGAGSSSAPSQLSSSSGSAFASSSDSVWLSSSSGPAVVVSSSASMVSSSSGVQVNTTSSTGVIINGTSSTGGFVNATSSSSANPIPGSSSSTGAASGIPQNTMSARFEIEISGTTVPADLQALIRTDLCNVIAEQFNTTFEVVDPFCLVEIGTPVQQQARRLLAARIPITFTLLGNITSVVDTTGSGSGPARTPMAAVSFIQQAIQTGTPILTTATSSLGIVVPVQEVVVENLSPPQPSSSTGLDEQYEDDSSDSLSDGAIAGIVVGVVVGVLLLGAIAYAAFTGKLCFKGAASVGVAHATTTPVHVKSTKEVEVV